MTNKNLTPNTPSVDAQAAADAAKRNNWETARRELLSVAAELGAKYAEGKGSLTAYAFRFAEACARGEATHADGPNLYVAFATAHNAKASELGHGEDAMPLDVSEKGDGRVPAAVFTTFGYAAPCRVEGLFAQVIRVRAAGPKEVRDSLSAYNALVRVNRAVQKFAESERSERVRVCLA